MKKKSKLLGTISSLVLAIVLMGFGVYAATIVSGKVQSSVSFVSKDVKCTFNVDVDGGKYLSGGVGTNEQEYRHKTQSVNNESVNTAHSLDEFVMGHYTFDPTTEAGKKITYTITITNDGSNEISVKYTADKKIDSIAKILQVTETNMQNVKKIAVGGSYIGKIELSLLDSSADIALKDIDITYEVSKAIPAPPTPLSSFTIGTPSNGTVSLTKFKGTETEVIIPDKDTSGNLITSIENYAFENCSTLASITISDSVTRIGMKAFNGCSALTSITIGSGTSSIGNDAFNGTAWYNNQPDGIIYAGKILYKYKGTCPEIINDIKSDTKIIADWAFANCSLLTNVTIPNSVIRIGESAFGSCRALTSVIIPSSVKSLENSAFGSCSALNSVIIEKGLTIIGNSAFSSCRALTSITIPSSVKSIGVNAFASCSLLKNVIIENGVESIGNSAFSSCGALASIIIPENASIGSNAFSYCNQLSSITVPDSVTSIGQSAFDYTAWYNNQQDGIIYAGKVLYKYKGTCPAVVDNIKTDTVSIADYAFSSCSTLTEITIPANVTAIGSKAFDSCNALTSFTIPDGVTEISNNAFSNCTALANLSLGTGVTKIGSYAFFGCSGLTSVTIPDSVTIIDTYAFYNCSKIATLNIGSGVTILGDSAFYNCSKISNLSIGNGVTTIGTSAFFGCTSLTSIIIPTSVNIIGSKAFSGCSTLLSVFFERTTVFTSLGTGCFTYLKSGSKLYFKNSTVMGQFNSSLFTTANTTKALY